MTTSTNHLVSKLSTLRSRLVALPVSLATVAVLSSAMLFHGTGVHASAITASPLDDNSVSALMATDHAMEALAARVTPAVVNVAVTSRATADETDADGQTMQQNGQQIDPSQFPPGIAQFFGLGGGNGGRMQQQQPEFQHGVGSGVIISPDGYIVTNNHVVDGATQIKVTLHDRRVLNAKVIGVDKLTDLAVIKVDAHELPAISWGDSTKLEPGQTVLAFGSPFGSLEFSVTKGIVSALDRPNMFRGADARKPGGYIQTDAAINPGNSGGPLVNVHGELVGINTGIMTDSGSFAGAGFAIPEQIAKATAEQIIHTGSVHHGYLGITMNDVTPENAHFFNLQQANGAIVAQVSPDSPASHAGLENGDVIERLNGQQMANGSAIQLAISGVTPGTKVELGILRNGTSKTIDLTLGEYHANAETASNDGDDSGASKGGKLGVGMADITPDVRQQIGLPDSVKGAAIESVRPGSPAEDAGLQPGDVIVQVNRKPVDSANAAVAGVHAVPNGQDVLLLVWSHGGESYRVLHPSQG